MCTHIGCESEGVAVLQCKCAHEVSGEGRCAWRWQGGVAGCMGLLS